MHIIYHIPIAYEIFLDEKSEKQWSGMHHAFMCVKIEILIYKRIQKYDKNIPYFAIWF